jgi:hypothetical protein
MADIYELLQRTHVVFERAREITEKEKTEHPLPARFLMVRAYSAWLGAVRLALSGQIVGGLPIGARPRRDREVRAPHRQEPGTARTR